MHGAHVQALFLVSGSLQSQRYRQQSSRSCRHECSPTTETPVAWHASQAACQHLEPSLGRQRARAVQAAGPPAQQPALSTLQSSFVAIQNAAQPRSQLVTRPADARCAMLWCSLIWCASLRGCTVGGGGARCGRRDAASDSSRRASQLPGTSSACAGRASAMAGGLGVPSWALNHAAAGPACQESWPCQQGYTQQASAYLAVASRWGVKSALNGTPSLDMAC